MELRSWDAPQAPSADRTAQEPHLFRATPDSAYTQTSPRALWGDAQ
jgi:hypothetical protein